MQRIIQDGAGSNWAQLTSRIRTAQTGLHPQVEGPEDTLTLLHLWPNPTLGPGWATSLAAESAHLAVIGCAVTTLRLSLTSLTCFSRQF